MDYFYIFILAGIGIGLSVLSFEGYSRARNKELHADIERLKLENEIFSIRAMNDGLEISRLEKDLKDERKQKNIEVGFKFNEARIQLSKEVTK